MHDLIDELRASDPARGHDLNAVDPEVMDDLRTAILATARPVRTGTAARWIGAAVGVAAVTTASLLLVPGLFTGRPVEATPGAPASPADPAPGVTAGRWTPTAPSPLSPRRDAIGVWVDGTYLIAGGDGSGACERAEGDCPPLPLRDGARYDPATDTWTAIADAPIDIGQPWGWANPYPRAVAIGRTAYLGSNTWFLAYDLDTDSWITLPDLPASATLAGVHDGRVVAWPASQCDPGTTCETTSSSTYDVFEPATRSWSAHTVELALGSSVTGATVVGDHLVVSWVLGNALGVATVDLRTDAVERLSDLGTSQRPVPVAAGGFAVWPRDETIWLLDPAGKEFSLAEQPASPGPFSGRSGALERDWYVVAAGMIALRGQLFDPASGLWSPAPALPISTQDPLIVGGDGALACFGYDAARKSYGDDCYVLTPAAAAQRTP